MNIGIPKEDAFEVSDSTDWLETPLASLAPVDSALRCQVCKDFYNTPMITSCAHTFCSLCIRRCLSNDGSCPACRAKDQELKLRFNGAMEGLVQAFIRARPEILGHAKRPMTVKRSASPKRRRGAVDADMEGEESEPRKRTRFSLKKLSSPRVMVIDSEEDEENNDECAPKEGFFNCPVCNKAVKADIINDHLDRGCQDEPTVAIGRNTSIQPLKPVPQAKSSKIVERLAQINYSMLKDGALRKKLTDQGLSAAGSRQLLMQRYTEWVTLWNANCDATKPKTKVELKREMDIWEKTQGGRAPSNHGNSGPQIRDKDFDGTAWSTKHDGDFRNLIANARRKTTKAATPEETRPGVPKSTATPPTELSPKTDTRDEFEESTQTLPIPSTPLILRGNPQKESPIYLAGNISSAQASPVLFSPKPK